MIDYNFLEDTSILNLIIFQSYFTIFYVAVVVAFTIYLSKIEFKVDKQVMLLITCLFLDQSIIMLYYVSHVSIHNLTLKIVVFTILSTLISYFLIKSLMKHLYSSYRYKENAVYLMGQYEGQLESYLDIRDSEEEVRFLRHEILNQYISLGYEFNKASTNEIVIKRVRGKYE